MKNKSFETFYLTIIHTIKSEPSLSDDWLTWLEGRDDWPDLCLDELDWLTFFVRSGGCDTAEAKKNFKF